MRRPQFEAQVRVQQASEGQVTLSDSLPRKRAKKSVGGFQGLPGSCPSFLQLAELVEAFAHLKFQAHIDVRRRSQSTPHC